MIYISTRYYDNATYNLVFVIETVQYNKYQEAWNTNVAILNEQTLFCDAFEEGEVVTYNNADYYVLHYSSTSDNYVTLLKKNPLTANEVNQYSDSYVSQDGEYPYYTSDTCNDNNQIGCSTNYDTSDVKKIVDGWSSTFSEDLVSIKGYKTRLVNYNDLFDSLYYHADITPSSSWYGATDDTPEWAYISNMRYWSTIDLEDSNIKVFNVDKDLKSENIYNKSYIRPVINLKKSLINVACSNKKIEYLYCDFGEDVTYDNQKYYVIKESESNNKSVTLLKADLLTTEEVNTYSNEYTSQDGEYPYLENSICTSSNTTNCSTNYDSSSIRTIIDNWSSSYNNDLVSIGGYKARLVNENELFNIFEFFDSRGFKLSSEDTPSWVILNGSKYWSMQVSEDSNTQIYGVSNTLSSENVYNKLYIRPVINLKKSAIESGCHQQVYNFYSIGETITYDNNDYCVIGNGRRSQDYVTLIKQEPLTYDELVTYNNGYEIGRDIVDNNSGIISYYKSDTCYYISDDNKNLNGCTNDYNNSYVKNIVDNWSNTISNDLKEVDGYKARLVTNDELNNMGHLYINSTADPHALMSDYNCLYGDADYFTMSSSGDDSNFINIVSKIVNNNGSEYVDKKYAVRPVINLKRCAIEGTC